MAGTGPGRGATAEPPTLELVLKRNGVERLKREKSPLGMLDEPMTTTSQAESRAPTSCRGPSRMLRSLAPTASSIAESWVLSAEHPSPTKSNLAFVLLATEANALAMRAWFFW